MKYAYIQNINDGEVVPNHNIVSRFNDNKISELTGIIISQGDWNTPRMNKLGFAEIIKTTVPDNKVAQNTVIEKQGSQAVEVHTLIDYSLDKKKRDKLNALKTHYKSVLFGGVTSLTKPMATNPEQLYLMFSIGVAASLDETVYPVGGVTLFTMEDEKVKPSLSQFKIYTKDVATHMVLCNSRYETHESAINALTTLSDVDNYDHTTGFPENPDVSV